MVSLHIYIIFKRSLQSKILYVLMQSSCQIEGHVYSKMFADESWLCPVFVVTAAGAQLVVVAGSGAIVSTQHWSPPTSPAPAPRHFSISTAPDDRVLTTAAPRTTRMCPNHWVHNNNVFCYNWLGGDGGWCNLNINIFVVPGSRGLHRVNRPSENITRGNITLHKGSI